MGDRRVGSELRVGRSVLALVQGDLTRFAADAIVNAANEALVGGGGVDGAIHRAGGPSIMEELEALGSDRRCPTGSAVVTGAGRLPARWVIHAVGPRWRGGGHGEQEQLDSAYRTALRLAEERAARSVALSAISAGIYGYPLPEAAEVALSAVLDHLAAGSGIQRATFVLYSDETRAAFEAALGRLGEETAVGG
ncbi:MAG TPA: macro domain-containing protein [Candidatus Limnocylindrales bacterium]|nr:macro domain-containing protein [Candidatus Limnocylindrales bacterium]